MRKARQRRGGQAGRGVGVKEERCFLCDEPTGMAGIGEDSVYCHDCPGMLGSFCSECYWHHLQDSHPYWRGAMIEVEEPFIGTVRRPGWECPFCGWTIGGENAPIHFGINECGKCKMKLEVEGGSRSESGVGDEKGGEGGGG